MLFWFLLREAYRMKPSLKKLYHVISNLSYNCQTWISRDMNSLRAGRSRNQTLMGKGFSAARPDRPWGPPSLLYNWCRVISGGKAGKAWRSSSYPSRAENHKKIPLYPSGVSWSILGRILTFFPYQTWKCWYSRANPARVLIEVALGRIFLQYFPLSLSLTVTLCSH